MTPSSPYNYEGLHLRCVQFFYCDDCGEESQDRIRIGKPEEKRTVCFSCFKSSQTLENR